MVRKYKNPEKYIETLKVRLERMTTLFHEWRDKCWAANGKPVVFWGGYDLEQNCQRYLEDVLPGQRVAIIGTATLVENKLDLSCNNKHGKLIIHVKETRVLPD